MIKHTMLDEWIRLALEMSCEPSQLYSGSRKILRGRMLELPLDDSVQLEDAGYTKAKLAMLVRHYLHEESQKVALVLWEHRKGQKKYGSVSFTTFNHYVKGKGTVEEIIAGRGKRSSVFGPCIQSVCITWVSRNEVGVDVFYRTTEFLKKFPADLVLLRDVLLKPFDLPPGTRMRLHFANITMHPMYFVTIIPHINGCMDVLENIRKADKRFFDWIIKWTARYLIDEFAHGIQKFAQSLRVKKDADARIPKYLLRRLLPYLRKHHIGFRGDDKDEDDDDE